MIVGSNVLLRTWEEKDISFLQDLRNDVKLQEQLLSRAKGSSTSQVKEWLEDKCRDRNSWFYVIAQIDDGRPIGYVQLTKFDEVSKHAELGICLGKDWQGKGLAGQAIGLLEKYVQDSWGLRKVILYVNSINKNAILCYQKAGFYECGHYRKHFYSSSTWHDIKIMEKILEK
jgi:diamine N-acetyltransferase